MGSPLKKKEYGFEFQATNNINKVLSHKQHQQSRKIANAQCPRVAFVMLIENRPQQGG